MYHFIRAKRIVFTQHKKNEWIWREKIIIKRYSFAGLKTTTTFCQTNIHPNWKYQIKFQHFGSFQLLHKETFNAFQANQDVHKSIVKISTTKKPHFCDYISINHSNSSFLDIYCVQPFHLLWKIGMPEKSRTNAR